MGTLPARARYLLEHWSAAVDNRCRVRGNARELRYLYASAVNGHGKPLLEKVIRSMDLPNCDFVVLCYDDTAFDEDIFRNVHVIHRKGMKWQMMREYLTREYCRGYDYLFLWDDDIDLRDFSFLRFIEIMQRNRLELAQPALVRDSHVNVKITRRRPGSVGRFTDWVENMVPVFTRSAWLRFREVLEPGRTYWGWQHVVTARHACGYRRMGIIDRECVAHTRPCQSRHTTAPEEHMSYLQRHPEIRLAKRMEYARMK